MRSNNVHAGVVTAQQPESISSYHLAVEWRWMEGLQCLNALAGAGGSTPRTAACKGDAYIHPAGTTGQGPGAV